MGQFDRVRHELLGGEGVTHIFAIRLPGAPTIPVDGHEALLQVSLERMGQVHGGHPGSAVEKQQHGVRRIAPPDKNALLHPSDSNSLQ